MSRPAASSIHHRIAPAVLIGVLIVFAILSVARFQLIKIQPAGVDFAGLWAGGKAAITDLGRIYDFRYVSQLQGWPLGPDRLRPYVYPPSALLLFTPFALAPWSISYAVWTVLTGGFFWWAGVRAGAPKWFVLVPWVAFAAFCGQATFLLGGLVMAAFAVEDERPIAAGILFGLAACVKPQLLMLLPLALIAEARWRTIVATGVTGAVVCVLATAIWGLTPWFEWLQALPRFEQLVSHARLLVANAITPYSALVYWRQTGTWALLLAPAAAAWVWFTFRKGGDMADRLIALFGGAFLISPYAMNYELALFAPATAIYLARSTDRRWPAYIAAAIGQVIVIHPAFISLAITLTPPFVKRIPLLPLRPRDPEASLIPNG
jgi:hypothetical protein